MVDALEVGVNAFDFGLAVHPSRPFNSVAAQVHQRAAARALHIVKPGGVGPVVLLTLFHQVDVTHRAFIRQFLGPHVFGRKK